MQSLRIFSHFRFEPKGFSLRSPCLGSQVEVALCRGREKGRGPAKFRRLPGLTALVDQSQSSGFLNESLYWHPS